MNEGRLWLIKGEPQAGIESAIDYYFLKYGVEFDAVMVREDVAKSLDGRLKIKVVGDDTIPPSHALFVGERNVQLEDEST